MGLVTCDDHDNKSNSPHWQEITPSNEPLEISLTMTEREQLAQQVAGDNYGLLLEPSDSRAYQPGRLHIDERRAFDAGWEAAKVYYGHQK